MCNPESQMEPNGVSAVMCNKEDMHKATITIKQAKEFRRKIGRPPTLQEIQREFNANYHGAVKIRSVINALDEGVVIAKRSK